MSEGAMTTIWMDGKLRPWEDGTIHVMSHGLHYGSGVFEGIKCYSTEQGPAIFRLNDHITRLLKSAEVYSIPVPYADADLVQACIERVSANSLESCYIRPIIFYGYDTLGVGPKKCPVHTAIATLNWGTYLGDEGLSNGVRITISPWVKNHHTSLPSTVKGCGHYANSLLAVQEAKSRGFDEALLMNHEGNISEGSGQNLFLVKDGTLLTNDASSSILMGITRESIIIMAGDMGIPVNITNMTRDMLLEADEAFFTGTASEVTPIRELDGHVIGTGKPGELTRSLQAAYFDIVTGKRPEYSKWLKLLPEPATPGNNSAGSRPVLISPEGEKTG